MTETNADSGWAIPRIRTEGADAVITAARATAKALDDLSFVCMRQETIATCLRCPIPDDNCVWWRVRGHISGKYNGVYFALRHDKDRGDYTLSLAGSNGVWQDVGDGKRWTSDREALAAMEAIVEYMKQ